MVGLHNAHVILYKGLLCPWAELQGRPLAQLVYYTEYMQEADPEWKPMHLRNIEIMTGMDMVLGDYRVEYYTADKRLIVTEPAMSLGAAKQMADVNRNHPDIAAANYAVMRCVLNSLDEQDAP